MMSSIYVANAIAHLIRFVSEVLDGRRGNELFRRVIVEYKTGKYRLILDIAYEDREGFDRISSIRHRDYAIAADDLIEKIHAAGHKIQRRRYRGRGVILAKRKLASLQVCKFAS